MKIDMDARGVLTIIAETGTEAYALRHWWDQYSVPDRRVDVEHQGQLIDSAGLIVVTDPETIGGDARGGRR